MRRSASGQLSFVFADSPPPDAPGEGGGGAEASDVSEARAWLLHTADGKKASESDAQAGEPTDMTHLLEKAASPGNLSRALLNVARNKGAAGVDGCSVDEVVESAQTVLPRLRWQLLSGGYQPGAIRRVWIPKPGGGERGLGIPNVVDRVVQQALLQVLEPVFEPTFHDSSHGFRPRRGAQTAIRRRLRAIIVRHKGRRPQFLFRHLRARGVPVGSAAKTAYGRRGVWFQSSTYGMRKAYGNDWFHQRLLTLMQQWMLDHPNPAWVSSRQLELFGG